MITKIRIRIAAVYVWIGFVCAISFMESWIKFTATGVTLTTGLAIGQLVFSALNKVEITIGLVILATILPEYKGLVLKHQSFLIAFGVLIIQSIFLLPKLSSHVDIYLAGGSPEPSPLHAWYVSSEIIKVLSLLFFGFKQLSV